MLEQMKSSFCEEGFVERQVGSLIGGNQDSMPAVIERTGKAEIAWFRKVGRQGRIGSLVAERSSMALQLDRTMNHVLTIQSAGALVSFGEKSVVLLEYDRIWISAGILACVEPMTRTLRSEIITWAPPEQSSEIQGFSRVRSVPPRKEKTTIHL